MPRNALAGLAAALIVATGCSQDSPIPTENHMATGLTIASIAQSSNAKTLNDLRRLTAPLHDAQHAEAAGYGLLVAPPLTAPDGCISDVSAGGMGYHYTRGNNLGDDNISLLDPEFIVYAPNGNGKRKLAALEYFIPYSTAWPGPADPSFVRAPRLSDFSSTSDLDDIALSPTRFGGWAIHIWLWEQNPDGMLTNWNPAVPLCDGSTY